MTIHEMVLLGRIHAAGAGGSEESRAKHLRMCAQAVGLRSDALIDAVASLTRRGLREAEAIARVRGLVFSAVEPESQRQAEALGFEFSSDVLRDRGIEELCFYLVSHCPDVADLAVVLGRAEALGCVLAMTTPAPASGEAVAG